MSRYDSVDLTFDLDPLPIVDRGRMWEAVAVETGRSTWTARPGFELAKGGGIGGIRDDGNTVGLRLSSKLFGSESGDGFTYANTGHVADLLNASGYFHGVRPDDLLAARVTRADPFLDVALGETLPAYVEALHLVTATGGERLTHKGRRKTPTFYATRPGDLFTVRQYGRAADLRKAKNREFREAHPVILDRAADAGLWRVEGNAVGVAALRQLAWMDRGDPTFSDVLRAPGAPLADALDGLFAGWAARVTQPMPLPSIPDNPADAMQALAHLSGRDQEKAIYARWVCDLAGGDLDAAFEILRQLKGAKNWHRHRGPIEAEIRRRAAEESAARVPALSRHASGPLAAVRDVLAEVSAAVRAGERVAA